ncbi:MAG: hypothetical protein HeimC3_07010 [Candidatus Heimdallarchaeota archaeon LC_3]|nr:MAG: hypothetical protein HeimC3_07010 [Candidatus Heimdallarchaeota archaeon LC_3]
MGFTELDKTTKKIILSSQQDEINSYYIYIKLAKSIKNEHNAEILYKISEDELKHYEFLKNITKKEFKPQKFKIWLYFIISRIFGLTFGIRLMERGEMEAQLAYDNISSEFPEIKSVIEDEKKHEDKLIGMLREDLLNYISSIVLGLNDALVELLGALAGFSLAFQDIKIIALAGFITGISASLSMGASEYLSTSEDDTDTKNPLKASIFTGGAYLIAVLILISPFLLLLPYNPSPLIPLIISVFFAVMIIFIFTFYISVAKNLPFKKRFTRMLTISLGVAFISLIIGFFVNNLGLVG